MSNIKWTKQDIISSSDTLPIEVARGCIFKCKFCNFPLTGKKKGDWIKNHNILLDEMLYNYETFGTTKYIFSDDTYNDSVEKITNLYENVYSKLPFDIEITTYLRLDLIYRYPHTAEILKFSGLKSAMFGLETNNEISAKAIGKGLSFYKQMDFLSDLKQHLFSDMVTHSGFIFGLPGDSKESISELHQYLMNPNQNAIDNWVYRPLSINPKELSWQKQYFSVFDLEYEKYGYEMIEEKSYHPRIVRWKNDKTGMTYDICSNLVGEYTTQSEKATNYKIGGYIYPRFSSIIDSKELRTLSRIDIFKKYDVNQLTRNWMINYYKLILNL